MIKQTPLLAIFCLLMIGQFADAQIKIAGTGKVCLGDLAFVSYAAPTGKTVTAYAWDFGDGYTSYSVEPTHLYKKSGKLTITLTATFSTGDTKKETLLVEVLDVPIAKFDFIATSDTCQFTNKICFRDNSKAAVAGQDLIKRALVWGDGTQTVNNNPGAGKIECKSYTTADKFYVEMEVTDNQGCKAFASRYVTILPSVQVRISQNINYPDCNTAEICYRNLSNFTTKDKITYAWEVDGQTSSKEHFANDPLCITFKETKSVNARLTATTKEGCKSIATAFQNVEINTVKRDILSDSVICYGAKAIFLNIAAVKDEQVKWFVNDSLISYFKTTSFGFKAMNKGLGFYNIRCELSREKCSETFTKKVRVIGPIAEMKIFNNPQCGVNRRVYFVDRSQFVDTPNTSYKWYVNDLYGDACTIDREKNINKYKNCNTTIGWFAKHDYTKPLKINQVILEIIDNKTGCVDTDVENVDLKRCGICQPFDGTIEICQNEMFLPGGKKEENPIGFSLDTGKTWLPFPSIIDTRYAGLYKVGLIYKWQVPEWAEDFGDDSIRIHTYPTIYYDTFFVKDLLFVKKVKSDSIKFEFSTDCNPFTATVGFQDGRFYNGEELSISWGDGNTEFFKFDKDQTLKKLTHAYNVPGLVSAISVQLISQEGCKTTFSRSFSFGSVVNIKVQGKACAGEEMCFTALVKDFATNKYWDNQNVFGTISWLFDNKPVSTSDFETCIKLGGPQLHTISLITDSKAGCHDTTHHTFAAQAVKAEIAESSKAHYCRGLRQFFDSSYLLAPFPGEYITKQTWDFGSGKFSSWQVDPIQTFDGTKKEILVRHAVSTNNGCTDTTEFMLRILTSKPYFTIDDSIGCTPLDVNFTNKSVGSSHFIWEFGDVNNATTETTDLKPQFHQYKTPGTYYIYLIGIDSFLNPVNKSIYYCHTAYPALGTKGVRVIVLPKSHPGFTGPDTLCMGEKGIFKSLSDSIIDMDFWNMGDGKKYEKEGGSGFVHEFTKDGIFTVKLDPRIGGQSLLKCMSNIEKKVVVLEIQADFEIDANSQDPVYDFINYSKPKNADFFWDFGHTASGSDNYSTQKNPSHNYKNDVGTHIICLIASSPNGCADTVCKSITNNYTEAMQAYNVFTPGNDHLNDAFEIELEGEAYHDLSVYNRWGEEVYTSHVKGDQSANISWNGVSQSTRSNCPSGTYFYVMKYAFRADPDKVLTLNGTVTLIR